MHASVHLTHARPQESAVAVSTVRSKQTHPAASLPEHSSELPSVPRMRTVLESTSTLLHTALLVKLMHICAQRREICTSLSGGGAAGA